MNPRRNVAAFVLGTSTGGPPLSPRYVLVDGAEAATRGETFHSPSNVEEMFLKCHVKLTKTVTLRRGRYTHLLGDPLSATSRHKRVIELIYVGRDECGHSVA